MTSVAMADIQTREYIPERYQALFPRNDKELLTSLKRASSRPKQDFISDREAREIIEQMVARI